MEKYVPRFFLLSVLALCPSPAAAGQALDLDLTVTFNVDFASRIERAEATNGPDEADWRAITLDSLRFLALQHGARVIIREHVREGLKGPFVKDYWRTLRTKPDGFWDGDPWVTNLVGHSIQGSATYRYARVNGATRHQAFWWGVAYSTQFELGLLGEAAIGNIATSPVDLVVTPLAGFGLGVVEEWLIERLPKRGDRFWLVTRPLLFGHVIVRLTTGKD